MQMIDKKMLQLKKIFKATLKKTLVRLNDEKFF